MSSAIFTIVGFFLGLYQSSRAVPKLTFAIKPIRLAVFSADRAPRLSARYKGQQVKGDITAARVFLWNAGKGAVDGNVRRAVYIYTLPAVPILEVTLKPLTKDDVSGLRLGTEFISQGRVRVMWNELEEEEGASIDILYNGSPDIKIGIEGRVKGQRNIYVYENEVGYDSPEAVYRDEHRAQRNRRICSPVVMIIGLTGMPFFVFLARRKNTPWERKNFWILTACFFAIFALGLAMYLTSQNPIPPDLLHWAQGGDEDDS